MKTGSSGQHTLFDRPAASAPAVPKGNKISIPGGKDATPDRLPTEEIVSGIPSAPAAGSKITASTVSGKLKGGR